MYENQSDRAIKQRMLDSIPSSINKSEGSFIYDAIAPTAAELAQAYIELDGILEIAFILTSNSEWLERRATEFGISRKPGTKASGTVTFTGTDGTVIPIGTLVQTEAGLQYRVTTSVTIASGTATTEIEAVEAGINHNIPSEVINTLPIQITGIISVTNTEPITGGTEIEDDEALRQRIIFKSQLPATSGNANHYKQWALDMPGVGDVIVFPLWDGPGTVKVVIIDSEKLPANDELVEVTQKYIDANRPVGALVTVVPATSVSINVSVCIKLDSSYILTTVLQSFRTELIEFFQSIAFKKSYVSYAQIGSILLKVPGVSDYVDLLVNNGTSNIPIQTHEVPVLNDVTLIVRGVL